MIRHILLSLCVLLAVVPGQSAEAQPKIKLVTFTADWCAVCQIMDPRLQSALAFLNDTAIGYVPVDLTLTRHGSTPERIFFEARLPHIFNEKGIGALHRGYAGYPYTGYSVVIAADTNEPLGCLLGTVPTDQIVSLLRGSLARYEQSLPYRRAPSGSNCPPAYSYLAVPGR